MAVEIKTGATFEPGIPAEMFPTRVSIAGATTSKNHYVPAADGQRFLVNTIPTEATSSPITVVLNWTAGLTR